MPLIQELYNKLRRQGWPPEESADNQHSVFYCSQCRNVCGTVPKAKQKVTVGRHIQVSEFMSEVGFHS